MKLTTERVPGATGCSPYRIRAQRTPAAEGRLAPVDLPKKACAGMLGLALLCLSAAAWSATANPPSCANDQMDLYPPAYNFQGEISPGVSWRAWSELLGVHWTAEQVRSGIPYDAAAIKRAIEVATKDSAPQKGEASQHINDYDESQSYVPTTGKATAAQHDAYIAAAKLYWSEQWDASIPKFDAIAADKGSPYRAAAAYSAARAALSAGKLDNGVDRIDALVRDPTLAEFHTPAYDLIGTLAWDTGSTGFHAAKYAEISHAVMMPTEVLCKNKEAAAMLGYEREDLGWYTIRRRPDGDNSDKRAVLDRLSAIDPVLDLFRVLAAPTPFKDGQVWPHPLDQKRPRQVIDTSAAYDSEEIEQWRSADGTSLTEHARKQWLDTGDPLWGLALAQRTADPADLPLLRDMLRKIDALPHTPALDDAQPALYWQFTRNLVRLLVMSGKTDAAMDLVVHNTRNIEQLRHVSRINFDYVSESGQDIVNGPIRWFLDDYDLSDARRWAERVSRVIPNTVKDGLAPLLATDYSVFVNHGDQAKDDWILSDAAMRQVVDFLPASKLAQLSAMRGLDKNTQRALLGAAFVRLYMLQRWPEIDHLLPSLATAFPELNSDIVQVEHAGSGRKQQFLLARLLLRSPGLVPYATQARALPDAAYAPGQKIDIAKIDPDNPNDGNWWCTPDLDGMKVELANSYYGYPLGYNLSPTSESAGASREQAIAIGNKLLAMHPLLKGAGIGEIKVLGKAESGPRRLTEEALAWARSVKPGAPLTGTDAEIPETLALAVRSTRYGCRRDGPLGVLSRAAYATLHKRFPTSDAAHKTPYWFDLGGH